MTKTDPDKGQESKLRKVALQELLNGARELVIVHNGREYRLRLTQNGKLILTA
jgi:hemin uptake protein HemP